MQYFTVQLGIGLYKHTDISVRCIMQAHARVTR